MLDMDGLLLDTERVYLESTVGALEELGFPRNEKFCLSLVGLSDDLCDARLEERFGPTFSMRAFLAAYESRKGRALRGEVPLKPGAVSLLRSLHASDASIVLTTGARRSTALDHLCRADLLEYFDAIISRDDVDHPKPAPDTYIRAASQVSADPRRCLALEDSPVGVESAAAAGFGVILVPDLVYPNVAIRALCEAVVTDLHLARAVLEVRLCLPGPRRYRNRA